MTDLEARLLEWLRHVRAGATLVVTERGTPLFVLIPQETAHSPESEWLDFELLDQLERGGA